MAQHNIVAIEAIQAGWHAWKLVTTCCARDRNPQGLGTAFIKDERIEAVYSGVVKIVVDVFCSSPKTRVGSWIAKPAKR